MTTYFRAIPQTDAARPDTALTLAGGWCWYSHVEILERGQAPRVVSIDEVPEAVLARMSVPRAAVAGLDMLRPQIMGILNVTPDSFSDGGQHEGAEAARVHATRMIDAGATIIDVGGESTRPGAQEVVVDAEIARTAPAIAEIRAESDVPISIDTRKAVVAAAALKAGASLINDVAGFTFDPALAPLAAEKAVPVCVMHAQGDPQTMQADPQYDNVLLDVYDFLETQVEALVALGIVRTQIIVDPGIGFGKTLPHNLALLGRISLFHSLGCPVLLGASRKRFVGTIGKAPLASDRAPGSIAVALEAVAQGVQIVRVHDVAETAQALGLWWAVTTGDFDDA
ncbi:Dihydropteroate synthase [Shimia sp. SK013]|uniref:dihydropteroate synthase n=1 Tax=Shimia sp. SK013 TaxID=1389006 RepID=UPI0006B5F6D6|nr:dihydropteroate synthase [Shimia sp. SK013]KPA20077.1 Dihydropteroate synthase [Shimia sp. SK013]